MTPLRSSSASYSHLPQSALDLTPHPHYPRMLPTALHLHHTHAPTQARDPSSFISSESSSASSSNNVVVPMYDPHFVYRGPPPDPDPAPVDASKQRRTRASRPKVKTGCITCKIRRIKCDEAKPYCIRCTSTGRTCDGYGSRRTTDAVASSSLPPAGAGGRESQLQLLVSPSTAFPGTVQEGEMFQRFIRVTIPALNGGSEAEFWHSLVLKTAVQEYLVRDAVLALAVLHEDYQDRQGSHDNNLIQQPRHQEALIRYGKSLRQVNVYLKSGQSNSALLAIITCALFTCFEILRRNDMTAIVHYQAGMRELLRQMTLRRAAPVGLEAEQPDPTVFTNIPRDDLDVLLRVFARYDVQACTFAKPSAEPLSATIPPVPASIVTLKDVRHHLDNLIIAAYQLINVNRDGNYRYWAMQDVPADWLANVNLALGMFGRWRVALNDFFRASGSQLQPADAKSLLGLRLQIAVAIIRLETSTNCGPETTYDAYRPEFEEMITNVERVTQSMALTDADPLGRESTPFTMELGIVHPLFYIATKCREHRLRKRAISQLRKVGKEGVWDGPVMAVLARGLMQYEERGLISGQTVPERQRIHRVDKLIQYDRRIITATIKLAMDAGGWGRWELVKLEIPF